MTKLYEIVEEFKALDELLALDGGEVTEDHEALIEQVQNLLTSKTDSMHDYIAKLNDEVELAKKHIERIQSFKTARENAVKSLKSYIHRCMENMETKKIKGELCEFSLAKSPQKLVIEDEKKIPVKYTKVKVEVDKTEIKKLLKNDHKIDGAKLVDGGTNLRIKNRSVN